MLIDKKHKRKVGLMSTKSKGSSKKPTTKKSATKKSANKKSPEKKVEVIEELEKVELDNSQEETLEIEENTEALEEVDAEKKGKKEVQIKAPRIINKDDDKPQKKEKKNKQKEIVRFSPQVKSGLTTEQVASRVEDGLVNVVKSKNTKTYRSIIFGNIFTFFNLLCFLVAGALIAVGAWLDCFFLIIVVANTLIGIIQEVKAKKTIEKIGNMFSLN